MTVTRDSLMKTSDVWPVIRRVKFSSFLYYYLLASGFHHEMCYFGTSDPTMATQLLVLVCSVGVLVV